MTITGVELIDWLFVLKNSLLFAAIFIFHELGHAATLGKDFIGFKMKWWGVQVDCFYGRRTIREFVVTSMFGFVASLPFAVFDWVVFGSIGGIIFCVLLASYDIYATIKVLWKKEAKNYPLNVPMQQLEPSLGWWE